MMCFTALAVLIAVTLAGCRADSSPRAHLRVGTCWEGTAAQALNRELLGIARELGEVTIDVHTHSVAALYDYLLQNQPRDSLEALDIAVVPSQWLGLLAQREIIAELPSSSVEFLEPRLVSQALVAARDRNAVLGFPLSAEVHALVYAPQVFPHEPRTWEEILAAPLPSGMLPFAMDLGDPYQLAPFLSSLQGSLLAPDGSLAWPRALTADCLNRLAPAWKRAGVWRAFHGQGVQSLQLQLFAEGRLASFVGGPWLLPALDALGRRYAVMPIPPLAGAPHPAQSVVSYQCLVVSRRSPWVDLAFEVGVRLLADEPSANLAQATHHLPVLASAYRDERGAATGRVGFLRALEAGQAFPIAAHSTEDLNAISNRLRAISARPTPPTAPEIAQIFAGVGP